jgi:hypothetical protein
MEIQWPEKFEDKDKGIKFLASVFYRTNYEPEWLLDENDPLDILEYVNTMYPGFKISRKEVADELTLIYEKRKRINRRNRLQKLKEEATSKQLFRVPFFDWLVANYSVIQNLHPQDAIEKANKVINSLYPLSTEEEEEAETNGN